MTIQEIIDTHEQLEKELKIALATMERSDAIFNIRKALIQNQMKCPHFDNKYNWAIIDGICPYCGFHLAGGINE